MGSNMAPSEIRFTQDSISEQFRSGQSLENTFRQLLNGQTSVASIGALQVVYYEGKYWVVSGNRRLYLYRKLQEKGRLSTVPVVVTQIDRQRVGAADDATYFVKPSLYCLLCMCRLLFHDINNNQQSKL